MKPVHVKKDAEEAAVAADAETTAVAEEVVAAGRS
jgi:hypothetical protein